MSMDSQKLSQLRKQAGQEPGSEAFVELARALLESPEGRAEAREVCFRGLNANPSHKLGRLLLARAFYLDGCYVFAARELAELEDSSSSPALMKLLEAFGPLAAKYRSGKVALSASALQDDDDVVAELDLDAGLLEVMSEVEKGE